MTNPMTPTPSTGDGLIERHEGFTPGPWFDNLHAGEKRDGGRYYVHIVAKAAGIVPIACVPTGVEGYGREEGRANARLAADAPALLDLARKQADTIQTLQTAVQAYLDRIDGGSRADTDYVTGLMRAALNSNPNTSGEAK